MRFLLDKIKAFELKVNSKYQEAFETNLKLMDENLDEFNLIKEELFDSMGANSDLFFNNFTMNILRNYNSSYNENIIKLLNKSFLLLIFKSVTYKDPPKKEETPPQEANQTNLEKTEDNLNDDSLPPHEQDVPKEKPVQKVYPPRLEPDQHDFEMLKAKGKLSVLYEAVEREELPYNAILKLHLSLNYNAPKKEEEKEQQVVNENEESFIEPFDGTSFGKLKEQYYGENIF